MQHLVYDIQGKELNVGDTVAFSYATNKALVIGTVNQIGKLIKRSYGVKFIGTRINIGHTSVWAESNKQVLLIKKAVESQVEIETQTPSHKPFLAVVNYDHETQIAKKFDTEGECKVWLFDEIEMGNCEDLLEHHGMINQPLTNMNKVAMYDDFLDYAGDGWDENGHILAWSDTKQYYGRY